MPPTCCDNECNMLDTSGMYWPKEHKRAPRPSPSLRNTQRRTTLRKFGTQSYDLKHDQRRAPATTCPPPSRNSTHTRPHTYTQSCVYTQSCDTLPVPKKRVKKNRYTRIQLLKLLDSFRCDTATGATHFRGADKFVSTVCWFQECVG